MSLEDYIRGDSDRGKRWKKPGPRSGLTLKNYAVIFNDLFPEIGGETVMVCIQGVSMSRLQMCAMDEGEDPLTVPPLDRYDLWVARDSVPPVWGKVPGL